MDKLTSKDGDSLGWHGKEGMTLRDWFAGQAVNGLTSNINESIQFLKIITKESEGWSKDLSELSYLIADALISKRNK